VNVFHAIPHTGLSVGGPYTIPVYIYRGMVEYRPTTTIIKLCRFTGSHKVNIWYVQFKCSLKVPLRTVLNRHRWGLPPWSLEYPQTTPQPSHLKILHFSLVASPDLKFKSLSNLYQFSILNYYSKDGSYMQVGPTTHLLPLARTKHSTSNGNIYYKRVTRIIQKGNHDAATFL
jgi:hypothetical protein